MSTEKKFLGETGLAHLWNKIKEIIPTKTSELTNDSGYIDDISGKQDLLVSGTNIKTINNTSLLGEGNIDTAEKWELIESIALSGVSTYTKDLDTEYKKVIMYIPTNKSIQGSSSTCYLYPYVNGTQIGRNMINVNNSTKIFFVQFERRGNIMVSDIYWGNTPTYSSVQLMESFIETTTNITKISLTIDNSSTFLGTMSVYGIKA